MKKAVMAMRSGKCLSSPPMGSGSPTKILRLRHRLVSHLPRFKVLGTDLVFSICSVSVPGGEAGLFARVGRNTLSASESASPSLDDTFSGPEVSAEGIDETVMMEINNVFLGLEFDYQVYEAGKVFCAK